MTAPAKVPRPSVPTPEGVYFVTRDRHADGTLADVVDVWTERPELVRAEAASGGALYWLGAGDLGLERRWCTWSIATAQRVLRNAVPTTERECVVVGKG